MPKVGKKGHLSAGDRGGEGQPGSPPRPDLGRGVVALAKIRRGLAALARPGQGPLPIEATLRIHGLYTKFSKCEFWLTLVAFLGHVISGEGISVDPSKIEAVISWPRSTTVLGIGSFLGLASY